MKFPQAKKLPSGKWHIDMQLSGRRVYITEPTKKAAESKAAILKAEYVQGRQAVIPSQMTLGQAIDQYIEQRQSIVSPETLRGYRVIRRNRFPSVIDTPIASIRNWQALINDEAKKYSAKTVKNAWGLVASVLDASDIRMPSVTLPQVVPNEHPFLQPEQLQPFLDAIRGSRFKWHIYAVCILSGGRKCWHSTGVLLSRRRKVGPSRCMVP